MPTAQSSPSPASVPYIDPAAAATERVIVFSELATIEHERAAILLRERNAIEAAKTFARSAENTIVEGIQLSLDRAARAIKTAKEQREKEMAVLEWRERLLAERLSTMAVFQIPLRPRA